MESADILGLAASLLTTLCMLPQVIKSYKSKSTRDLSWGYLGTLGSALLLWIAYGFLISSFPLILGNSIAEAMALILIFLKLKYG